MSKYLVIVGGNYGPEIAGFAETEEELDRIKAKERFNTIVVWTNPVRFEAKKAPDPPVVHGLNCVKVAHGSATGYLHAPDDERPYDVDGVWYCGRCHTYIATVGGSV